jgi:hypothetical protein
MAHGVSPNSGESLLNGKEDKEDVYEDALMEATVDESETAATAAAAEEKTTSASAEVPGSKAEEANTEERCQWQQERGTSGEERSDPTAQSHRYHLVMSKEGVTRNPPTVASGCP